MLRSDGSLVSCGPSERSLAPLNSWKSGLAPVSAFDRVRYPLKRQARPLSAIAGRRQIESCSGCCMRRREFVRSLLSGAVLWTTPALLAIQVPAVPQAADSAVKRVLVMFKCHFDAGF